MTPADVGTRTGSPSRDSRGRTAFDGNNRLLMTEVAGRETLDQPAGQGEQAIMAGQEQMETMVTV